MAGLRSCPPQLYFEPLQLPTFDFNSDPDPASKNNADTCWSGSATLVWEKKAFRYCETTSKVNFATLTVLNPELKIIPQFLGGDLGFVSSELDTNVAARIIHCDSLGCLHTIIPLKPYTVGKSNRKTYFSDPESLIRSYLNRWVRIRISFFPDPGSDPWD